MCHTTRRAKIASAHPPLVPRLETRLAATSLTFAAHRPRASQVPLVTNALFLNRSPKGERSARTARIRAKRSARPHALQALQTLSVSRGGRVRGRACEARRERASRPARVDAVSGMFRSDTSGRRGVPSRVAPGGRAVFRSISPAASRTAILPSFFLPVVRARAPSRREIARPARLLTSVPPAPSRRIMSGEGGFNDEAYDRGMQEL
jgi:hypothetical protein